MGRKTRARYTTAMVTGEISRVVLKIIRSVMFNIFMVGVGFGIGYFASSQEVKYCASFHTEAERLTELKQCIYDLESTYVDTCMPTYQKMRDVLQKLEKKYAYEAVQTNNDVKAKHPLLGKSLK